MFFFVSTKHRYLQQEKNPYEYEMLGLVSRCVAVIVQQEFSTTRIGLVGIFVKFGEGKLVKIFIRCRRRLKSGSEKLN